MAGTNREIHFGTNGISNQVVIQEGRVGIGTLYPNEELDVNGDIRVRDGDIYLKESSATENHGLGWYGVSKALFAGEDINGPVLYGYSGGALGVRKDQIGYENIALRWDGNGNVGIGTSDPIYKLDVRGTGHFCEVRVKQAGWCDYVFKDNYNLMGLDALEKFIQQNHHLPDVPSEKEVKENGINLGEMDAILLQKIEELTLYTIEQQKLIDGMRIEMQELINK